MGLYLVPHLAEGILKVFLGCAAASHVQGDLWWRRTGLSILWTAVESAADGHVELLYCGQPWAKTSHETAVCQEEGMEELP